MFKFARQVTISYDEEFSVAAIKLREYLKLFYGIDATFETHGHISIIKENMLPENYSIFADDSHITVGASDIRGTIYGVSTLLQMIDRETMSLENTNISHSPYKEFRGAHLYLPSRKNINAYKRILDVLSFFKMNTVIIEVGGAMEYERHPEINEKWEWFCNFSDNIFPGEGKSRSVQWADTYWKDSIHTEHAGGSFLSKTEVRDIVSYAKNLGLKVIPEIQALSHAYYLTLAHREIAELSDDMFPDSYCPLNEKSYELYFDVAKEVIEVFEPEIVSVGHDEIRVLGQCDKCRQKTGHELLSYDLNKLHEFYKKYNIQIMMWAEKLQHYVNYKGVMVGEPIDKITDYGFRYTLPATYDAKKSIPKDILLLDWHYSQSHHSEQDFCEDGFNSLFGNFRGSRILNWQTRSHLPTMLGAEVSTWVVTDEKNFARDGIFFEFMFSANILWNPDYDNDKYEEMVKQVINQMYFTKAIMRGHSIFDFDSEVVFSCDDGVEFNVEKSDNIVSKITKTVKGFGNKIYGLPIDTAGILVKKEFCSDALLILHSAKKDMEYIPSHKFPDYSKYGIGAYVVLYEDGTIECINAEYGTTIANLDFKISLGDGKSDVVSNEIDDAQGSFSQDIVAPVFSPVCNWNDGILYDTVPLYDGEKTIFAYMWENPHPDKKIVKIKAINTCRDKTQSAILFGIAAIKEKK